jgi:dephospho-CoA kinase
MRRNGFTREQVSAIVARQASREARLAAADDVLVNEDGRPPELVADDVQRLHEKYRSSALATLL